MSMSGHDLVQALVIKEGDFETAKQSANDDGTVSEAPTDT
jgi:hypothetical protein